MNTFMLDIKLPESPGNDFIQLIPHQRDFIKRMMKKGVIQNYSISYDRRKLWVVINVDTLHEAKELLGQFPIFNHISFEIHNLLFHNSNAEHSPQFWLN